MTTTSSLAHHRLFDNYDVLVEICEHLAEMDESKSSPSLQGRGDLARTATCSKALSAPALDVLWKSLDSDLPLLKLLPGFQKAQLGDVWILSESEPIRDVDWRRFNEYARRIRLFKLKRSPENVDISVYLRLALLKKAPFLPSLSQLICSSPTTRLLPYLVCSLREVEVELTHYEDKDQAFLRALTENAPMLQSLTMTGHLSPGSVGILVSCRALRTLNIVGLCTPLDQPSLDVLSFLPQLSALTINLKATSIDFMSQSATSPFAELQTLEVIGDMPSITGLLEFISSPRLSHLVLSSDTNTLPDQWRTCIHTLISTTRYANSIRSIVAMLDFHKSQISTMLIFEPLLGLKGLVQIGVYLSFHRDGCQGLVEGNWALLASAWPNIKTLEIIIPPDLDPLPTFTSILTFALHCPQLRVLALTFDLTNLPPASAVPVLSHGLTEINLLQSNIGANSKHLVRLLDRVFPHLDFIVTGGSIFEDSTPGELDDLRQLCQDARKDAHVRWAEAK